MSETNDVDCLVMRQTETMTCEGCVYAGEGSRCNRPDEATHCMSDGREFIYVRKEDV